MPSLYLLSWVTQNSIEFLSQWPVNSTQVFLRLVPCIEFAVIAGHSVANDGRNVRIIPGKLSILCAFYVLTMADTDIDGRVQGTCIAIGKNTIQGWVYAATRTHKSSIEVGLGAPLNAIIDSDVEMTSTRTSSSPLRSSTMLTVLMLDTSGVPLPFVQAAKGSGHLTR